MSAYAQDYLGGELTSQPGIEFLQKPFTFDAFAFRIQDILRKRKRRVLIVGDDREVTLFASQVLGEAGFEVLEAADGRGAESIAKYQSIDLVIADLFMPKQQGVETFLAVRRVKPSVPIIAVSGTFGGEFVKAALAFGSQAALTKPFTAAKLLETVWRILRVGPDTQ
jgi:DNA-binding response OmpR family regulator